MGGYPPDLGSVSTGAPAVPPSRVGRRNIVQFLRSVQIQPVADRDVSPSVGLELEGETMETEAAILWGIGEDWKVETIQLDPPKAGEVLVRIAASGMCHSDEHLRTGDLGGLYPISGGHEGAGVVEEVGPEVQNLAPGDHVVFGFVPACGVCPSCARGHSSLRHPGPLLMLGCQLDGTHRHHASNGEDLRTMVCLGTFAKRTVVNQASCV